MVAAAVPIQWGTLKYDPTEAKPSKNKPEWAPQHSSVAVLPDGAEQRIYFTEGPLSHLHKGDSVMLEYSRGRWRLSKTQTPELLTALEKRQQQAPSSAGPSNVAQMPQRTVSTPKTASQKPSKQQIERYVSGSARLFGHCWGEAAATLPSTATSEDIRSVATTLFIQAARRFSL